MKTKKGKPVFRLYERGKGLVATYRRDYPKGTYENGDQYQEMMAHYRAIQNRGGVPSWSW